MCWRENGFGCQTIAFYSSILCIRINPILWGKSSIKKIPVSCGHVRKVLTPPPVEHKTFFLRTPYKKRCFFDYFSRSRRHIFTFQNILDLFLLKTKTYFSWGQGADPPTPQLRTCPKLIDVFLFMPPLRHKGFNNLGCKLWFQKGIWPFSNEVFKYCNNNRRLGPSEDRAPVPRYRRGCHAFMHADQL